MNCLLFVLLSSTIPYLRADPSPDTNVQIQNYDGPIYLHSPKSNICPHCNGYISPLPEQEDTPCEDYPRKAIYGTETAIISSNVATTTNTCNPVYCSTDNINSGTAGITFGTGTTVDTLRTTSNMVAKNTVPLATSPVTGLGNTCTSGSAGTGILGNTLPITFTFESPGYGSGNSYYGACNPVLSGSDCVKNPLTGLFNTKTTNPCYKNPQNTNPCYKVPSVTCNQGFGEDGSILVPQKFSYSLILDGEVANGNGNQNCPMEYCFVI